MRVQRKHGKQAPAEPKYPSKKVKCRYCHCMFATPPTFNGSKMQFCIPAHRKAFDKEGRKPIHAILKRQEKHMRQIAREEFEGAMDDRFRAWEESLHTALRAILKNPLAHQDLEAIIRETARSEFAKVAEEVKRELEAEHVIN